MRSSHVAFAVAVVLSTAAWAGHKPKWAGGLLPEIARGLGLGLTLPVLYVAASFIGAQLETGNYADLPYVPLVATGTLFLAATLGLPVLLGGLLLRLLVRAAAATSLRLQYL